MRNIKHWQDPLNALLGIWMVASPWIMSYQHQMAPTVSAVIVGLALLAAALGASFVPRAWEESSQIVLGIWMLISPWVLGFSGQTQTMQVAVVSGLVAVVLSLWVFDRDKDYRMALSHTSAN